jgi:hypothetical protein
MRRYLSLALAILLIALIPASATVFAIVRGVVHDPQHRPIVGATVTLQAVDSSFALSTKTDSAGEFGLPQAPIGIYRLTTSSPGFTTDTQTITLDSGTNPVVHIALALGGTTQTVLVQESLSDDDSVTPTTLVTRRDIDETPGADRTIGTEMITDYVPGAYMTHDMLHMRGGHQTSWLIDGISIPNTKIASNVGPQIDPKDIDQLETQRGSYASDIGDRTYGVFNVLRGRTVSLWWQPLHRRSAGLTRRPQCENSLVRELRRLPLKLRPGHPGSANPSRRHQFRQRFRFADPQPNPKGSVPPRCAIPPGLFPGPLRSKPQ